MRIFNTSFVSEEVLRELAYIALFVPLILNELHTTGTFIPAAHNFMRSIEDAYQDLITKAKQPVSGKWQEAFQGYSNQVSSLLEMPTTQNPPFKVVTMPKDTFWSAFRQQSKIDLPASLEILNLCLTLLSEIKGVRLLWRKSFQDYINIINNYIRVSRPQIDEVRKQFAVQTSSVPSPGSAPLTVAFLKNKKRNAAPATNRAQQHYDKVQSEITAQMGADGQLLKWLDHFTTNFPGSEITFDHCYNLDLTNLYSKTIQPEQRRPLELSFSWLVTHAKIHLASEQTSIHLSVLIKHHFKFSSSTETADTITLGNIISHLKTILGRNATQLISVIERCVTCAEQKVLSADKNIIPIFPDVAGFVQFKPNLEAANKLATFSAAQQFASKDNAKAKSWLNIIEIFRLIKKTLASELDYIAVYLSDSIILRIIKITQPVLLVLLKDLYTTDEWQDKIQTNTITKAEQQIMVAPATTPAAPGDELTKKIEMLIKKLKNFRDLAAALNKIEIPIILATREEHEKLYNTIVQATNGLAYGYKQFLFNPDEKNPNKKESPEMAVFRKERDQFKPYQPVTDLTTQILIDSNPDFESGLLQLLIAVSSMEEVKREPGFEELAKSLNPETMVPLQLLITLNEKLLELNNLASKYLPDLDPYFLH